MKDLDNISFEGTIYSHLSIRMALDQEKDSNIKITVSGRAKKSELEEDAKKIGLLFEKNWRDVYPLTASEELGLF